MKIKVDNEMTPVVPSLKCDCYMPVSCNNPLESEPAMNTEHPQFGSPGGQIYSSVDDNHLCFQN